MSELRRKIEASQQGRDRLDAARQWAADHGGALDRAALDDLANGPILDANRLALPLGKCSEAEWTRRNKC